MSEAAASPQLVRSVREWQEIRPRLMQSGAPLCFVPTMGDLHAGHLGLARIACSLGPTVVSIFVNPTQFAPGEDFDRYPRRLESDLTSLSELGVDVVYAPEVSGLYPSGEHTRVEVQELTGPLCGQHREGHFLGVTTVCSKLFNILRPDVAVFGQKDAQQCLVIDRLLRDLHFGIDLCIGPTGRADDGVALSSRNRYLSAEERPLARALSQALDRAEEVLRAGVRETRQVEAAMRERFASFAVDVDYADLRSVPDLVHTERVEGRILCAVAAIVGKARLLDNRCFEVDGDVRIAPLLDYCTPTSVAARWSTRAPLPEEFQ